MPEWDRHKEFSVDVAAPPEAVFAFLDDPKALGAHMGRRSAMMMGGRMAYRFDADSARTVGSVIRMEGSLLGLWLAVTEVVTAREPPTHKAWETRGPQRIVVMAGYRMGFDVTPSGNVSRVRLFIDYDLPEGWLGRLLAGAVADLYAAWCLRKMGESARSNFVHDATKAAS